MGDGMPSLPAPHPVATARSRRRERTDGEDLYLIASQRVWIDLAASSALSPVT